MEKNNQILIREGSSVRYLCLFSLVALLLGFSSSTGRSSLLLDILGPPSLAASLLLEFLFLSSTRRSSLLSELCRFGFLEFFAFSEPALLLIFCVGLLLCFFVGLLLGFLGERLRGLKPRPSRLPLGSTWHTSVFRPMLCRNLCNTSQSASSFGLYCEWYIWCLILTPYAPWSGSGFRILKKAKKLVEGDSLFVIWSFKLKCLFQVSLKVKPMDAKNYKEENLK